MARNRFSTRRNTGKTFARLSENSRQWDSETESVCGAARAFWSKIYVKLIGEDAESPCLPAPTLVGVKMRKWRRDASCFVVARLPSVKLQKTRLEECVRETTNYHLRIRWRRRRRRSDDDDDDAEFDDDVVMWTIDTTI